MIVQKPELTFLLETEDFNLYQTLNGIYLKFKDSFIEEYGTEKLKYRRFSVTIRRKNIFLGFKPFDFLAKDKELSVAYFRGEALRMDDLLFYLYGTEPDPMLVHYARGGNTVIAPFSSEDVLTRDEEVEIEIRLLKDSLGIYSDSLAIYPGLRFPAMQRTFWDR